MKTSKVIFDIQAREGVVARASFHRENPGDITTSARQYPITMPAQCAVMTMTNYCLSMLREAAETDPTIKGRYTFIVPDNVAIRFFEAQKCVNSGNDIVSTLMKGWMRSPQYDMEFENTATGQWQTVNVWEMAIVGLAAELQIMMNKSSGWSLNFINSRTLYRYEIRSAKGVPTEEVINAGDVVNFVNGVDVEKELLCTEQNFLSGQLIVSRRDVRDRNQHVTPHFYVPRMIQVENIEDGSRHNMTADQIINNDKLEPVYQNGVYIVNAAFLRTKTAEMLPRITKIRNVQVTAVEGESKQF